MTYRGGWGQIDVRLPGKGNSNLNGVRPVHLIITMIKWIRISRLAIENTLSGRLALQRNRLALELTNRMTDWLLKSLTCWLLTDLGADSSGDGERDCGRRAAGHGRAVGPPNHPVGCQSVLWCLTHIVAPRTPNSYGVIRVQLGII